MTRQYVKMHVPRPATTVGLGLNALSEGHSGFCATTDGHVWLTALDGSTLSAHAEGPTRFVSTDDHVFVAAEVGVINATTGGFTVAAGGGIRVIAGHEAEPALQPADERIDSPDAADDVSDGCDTVANAWAAADLAVASLFAAKEAGMAVLAGPANARIGADAATVSGVLGIAGNLAASATNAAGLGGATVPGINIHGLGGVNLFTPAFASFYGMAGMLFASPFSTQVFGAATVGVVGLASAGMSSLGKADLSSASGVTVEASGPVQVKSMPGEVVMKGSSVVLGQVLPDPKCPAQMPTLDIGLQALAGMRLKSPKGNVRFGRVPIDVLAETKINSLVDTLETLESSGATIARKTAGSLETLVAMKKGAGAAKELPGSLLGIQKPPMDPVYTMTNDVVGGAAATVLVKDAVKLQVGPWVVTVNEDGILLGSSHTPPSKPGAPKIPEDEPHVKVGKTSVKLSNGSVGGQFVLKQSEATIGSRPDGTNIRVSADGLEVEGEMVTLS